jgi:hypothetical protein
MTDSDATTTAAEPRPKRATKGMIADAASLVVDRLIRNGHLKETERASSIADLAGVCDIHSRHLDGYQIAKRLDDGRGWDCDLQMAEDLDGLSYEIDRAIATAEKEWFERTKPQPPFPVGAQVAFGSGRATTGTIDGIYEHGPAKYAVKVDGDAEADTDTQRRSIVNFEDVRAV